MAKNKIILGILVVVAIFVGMAAWKALLRSRVPANTNQEVSLALDAQNRQKSRTKYKTWGRNPFTSARISASGVTGLWLGGIIYNAQGGYALINNQIVHVGDEVNGNRIVDIKRDRVILNDGSKDFELKL